MLNICPVLPKLVRKGESLLQWEKIILAVRFVYHSKSFFILPVCAVWFIFSLSSKRQMLLMESAEKVLALI